MLPKVWLKQFLESRSYTSPDDHPLYRYRMSHDNFESLKITLKTSAMLGVANLASVTGWNAVFVIYAAEWWRREYDGSSWKWENHVGRGLQPRPKRFGAATILESCDKPCGRGTYPVRPEVMVQIALYRHLIQSLF